MEKRGVQSQLASDRLNRAGQIPWFIRSLAQGLQGPDLQVETRGPQKRRYAVFGEHQAASGVQGLRPGQSVLQRMKANAAEHPCTHGKPERRAPRQKGYKRVALSLALNKELIRENGEDCAVNGHARPVNQGGEVVESQRGALRFGAHRDFRLRGGAVKTRGLAG